MNYILIFLIVFFMSYSIKRYVYCKLRKQSHINWILSLYTERRISILIDIILMVIFLAIYNKYKISISFFTYIAFSSILLTVSIVDIETKIIPDILVIIGAVLGIFVMLINKSSMLSPLLGAVICGGIIALISLVTRGAIGMGDAKLFACIGIFLGLQNTLGVMLMSTILSGLTGLVLLTFRVVNRKTLLPFAPFISASALFIMIFN